MRESICETTVITTNQGSNIRENTVAWESSCTTQTWQEQGCSTLECVPQLGGWNWRWMSKPGLRMYTAPRCLLQIECGFLLMPPGPWNASQGMNCPASSTQPGCSRRIWSEQQALGVGSTVERPMDGGNVVYRVLSAT